ncbi:Cmx/CmrA family chloramphenicol efflux MFS transporter [Glycomyces harbinensis]|uniref:MFS transporter, DHA1 family, chloramphenicol resistance protein n=1 Tax=Glycomyces harbinensis TaxID=58114 RepID=A0A1G6R8Q9_9ACTN|nr:Cmx/CmrA family chloramphenicol efflux MFS transporter [Glycomyces harbinensis]SDD00674.1 MFS transporter, DHA1 family, chloramphenicol resistance protein [Glycomyces harbinensis]
MPFLLHMLAVAVFAQGCSEFMFAGLLPDVSADLGVTVAQAGLLTSAFAAGMVIGAPVMAALGRRWSPRGALAGFLALFIAAHVVGALTDRFGLLLATRAVAAMANAGFLAVALSTVAALVPAHARGRALATVLGGTTLALVAGAPAGALLGDAFGWRSSLWAVAIVAAAALLAVLAAVPARTDATGPRPVLRAELAVLARPSLRLVLVLAVLVNGATFGGFTFLAPLATDAAGLGAPSVPVVLALFGLGAFTGVWTAGRLADRHWRTLLAAGTPLLLLGWILLASSAGNPVALHAFAFALGALSFAVGATLIGRTMAAAHGAPTMSGSYATAALNVGAMLGPALAGIGYDAFGPLGPPLAGAGLVLAAVLTAAARKARRPQALS